MAVWIVLIVLAMVGALAAALMLVLDR